MTSNLNSTTPSSSSPKMSGLAIAAAAAALFAMGVASPAHAAMDGAKGDSVHCTGVNGCKGMSECKSAGNECKGMNGCKGQGWMSKSADECKQMGGKAMKG